MWFAAFEIAGSWASGRRAFAGAVFQARVHVGKLPRRYDYGSAVVSIEELNGVPTATKVPLYHCGIH